MRELDNQNTVGDYDADHHDDTHQSHHIQGGAGQGQDQQYTADARWDS